MGLEIVGDVTPVQIEYIDKEVLLPEERAIIDNILTRRNLDSSMADVVAADGRNVYLRRYGTHDPRRDFIQLSGGFYRPITPVSSGICRHADHTIQFPNNGNFANLGTNSTTTCYIRVDGSIEVRERDYAPIGGYTSDDADRKIRMTRYIENTISSRFLMREKCPFFVPYVVGKYALTDVLDSYGSPICGIIMLSPNPLRRFGSVISEQFKSQLTNGDVLDFIYKALELIYGMTFKVSASARWLHDNANMYHGQMTLGNNGMTLLGYSGNSPILKAFVADWHTAEELPLQRDAQLKARALELLTIFHSGYNVLEYFISITTDNADFAEFVAGIGALSLLGSVIFGYDHNRLGGIDSLKNHADLALRVLSAKDIFDSVSSMKELLLACSTSLSLGNSSLYQVEKII